MELDSSNQDKNSRSCDCIKAIPGKFKAKVVEFTEKTKKIGQDDPRRIAHSAKVGLALTLVSFFYYFRPLYDGFGQAGMWAILTVVVVFEYTVGGTLLKCFNRGFATLLAGALGIGAEYLATLCGEKGEPVLLGILVFILATTSTFMRFFPSIKRRYDYGVLIFILTFSLVAVSGFRVDQIIQLAHQRLSTILIGAATCIVISIFICPVWAGQDLHNLASANIEKLASFLQVFGDEGSVVASKDVESILQGYKTVLNAKATEESLANFACWEPCHGRFKFHHPWKQYLKIGVLVRECACHIEALSGYRNSKPQVPSEFSIKIHQLCVKISLESGKSLNDLAAAIKNMVHPCATETHIKNSIAAANELKSILESSSSLAKPDLQEIMPALVVASILIDIIKCIEKISESIHELSGKAHFKNNANSTITPEKQQQKQWLHRGIVKPINDANCDHVAIEILGTCEDNSSEK
ncbi:Aluminum-activated malate transporter 8 [Abeliophyllum distichum]|uniref:Aluminum-activated malate transporter 8 n=1 Tax=Abeliophyllum distichum TaxID=126358 RepID=A0ABD1R018_9LAMI